MSSVYHIHKGVARPIEFKGFRAQYIIYLAVGLVALLIAFAVLYVCGLPFLVILPVIGGLGTGLFWGVGRLSRRFGEHGLGKYFAKKQVPGCLKCRSRKVFIQLKNK